VVDNNIVNKFYLFLSRSSKIKYIFSRSLPKTKSLANPAVVLE